MKLRPSLVSAYCALFLFSCNFTLSAASIVLSDPPLSLTAGQSYQVTADYETDVSSIVMIQLVEVIDSTWEQVVGESEAVAVGSGSKTLDILIPAATGAGSDYIWQAMLFDDAWAEKLAEDLQYNVAVGAAQSPDEWLPAGEWDLDWFDEFSGAGMPTQWFPMLGYNHISYASNEEKGLRWSGTTEETSWMYSTKTGNHWLNGAGQLVIRAVCDKTQSNDNGLKVETAYLMSGYPDSWDESELYNTKWAGKFVSPADGALYISARVRTDQVVGHSTWFAFWLFSQTRAYNSNPVDGTEVDIIEIPKGDPDYMDHIFNVANHWAQTGGSESKQFNPLSDPPALSLVDVLDSEYHVYGLEWTTDYMKCYVDGQLFYTFTENIPSDPVDMMMLLTMEFKPNAWDPGQGDGRSSGPYVSDTPELREMSRALVDYVRVYVRPVVTPSEAAFHTYLESYGLVIGDEPSGEDSDGDSFANIFEYAYQTNPALAGDAINLVPAMSQQTGAVINASLGTTTLDPAKRYYTQTIRLPNEPPVGVQVNVQSTLNLPQFGDGSTTVVPFGEPVDAGDNTHLQKYYQVEDIESARMGFIRVEVSIE